MPEQYESIRYSPRWPSWRDAAREKPPENERVLVYAPRDGHAWPEVMTVTWYTERYGWMFGSPARITHWAPLPPPPTAA